MALGALGSVKGLAGSFKGELITRANLIGAGVVAAAGILGLGGGFDAAPPRGLISAAAAPGGAIALAEPITAGALEVELGRTYEFAGSRSVEMRVTNTSAQPMDTVSFNLAFRLAGVEAYAQSHRLVDGQPGSITVLNPDVPVDVVVDFDHSGPATLDVYSLEYRTSFLDGSKQWFTKDLMAQVELK